jgi:hypothetical protein
MADRNPVMWTCAVLVNTGVFTPILAKHSKSFNLIDTLSVGVDRIQGTSSQCGARSRAGDGRKSPMTERS